MFEHPIILASQSPRRKSLLSEIANDITVLAVDIDESIAPSWERKLAAQILAQKKSKEVISKHPSNYDKIIVAADTIVLLNDQILGKPCSHEDAKSMLHQLSDQTHQVITGVSVRYLDQEIVASEITSVTFRALIDEEIDYYVDHFRPMDKAGAYGIQEWIGMVGITRIEGDYYNVMGLPVQAVYDIIQNIVSKI